MVAQWLAQLPLVLEVRGSIPARGEEMFRSPNKLSLVSFAVMTLNKCAILQISTLTGCPLCKESPPVQVKEPYGNLDMVTCRLSSCNSEEYIPANNACEGVRQYR